MAGRIGKTLCIKLHEPLLLKCYTKTLQPNQRLNMLTGCYTGFFERYSGAILQDETAVIAKKLLFLPDPGSVCCYDLCRVAAVE